MHGGADDGEATQHVARGCSRRDDKLTRKCSFFRLILILTVKQLFDTLCVMERWYTVLYKRTVRLSYKKLH